METTYSVKILRSGQPRPYADTEREYLITIKAEQYGKEGLHPWLCYGDVESKIKNDEKDRAEGRLFGGMSPDRLRQAQREWAKRVIRGLCQDFRERGDIDGREGAEAYFYPTLQSLTLDWKAGTIRALIIEPFTD